MPLNGVGELVEYTRKSQSNRKLRSRDSLAKRVGVPVYQIRRLERIAVFFPEWGWKVIETLGINKNLVRRMLAREIDVDPRKVLREGVKARAAK